jgi:1-pyrroline-5-carboxylate dehydrogenase
VVLLNTRDKNAAASRAYIPSNIAAEVKKKLVAEIKTMKMGTVEDFTNFINAVIDEKSFDKLEAYIKNARKRDRMQK